MFEDVTTEGLDKQSRIFSTGRRRALCAHPRMFDGLKVRKRLLEVEEECSALKREMTRLQVEWTDTLDRLKSMLGRIVKDRARAEAARTPSPDQLSLSDEDVASGHTNLTQTQEAINQKILARRNRTRPMQ